MVRSSPTISLRQLPMARMCWNWVFGCACVERWWWNRSTYATYVTSQRYTTCIPIILWLLFAPRSHPICSPLLSMTSHTTLLQARVLWSDDAFIEILLITEQKTKIHSFWKFKVLSQSRSTIGSDSWSPVSQTKRWMKPFIDFNMNKRKATLKNFLNIFSNWQSSLSLVNHWRM